MLRYFVHKFADDMWNTSPSCVIKYLPLALNPLCSYKSYTLFLTELESVTYIPVCMRRIGAGENHKVIMNQRNLKQEGRGVIVAVVSQLYEFSSPLACTTYA